MKLRPDKSGWILLMCDRTVINKVRVCVSCGEFVDKWAGEFSTDKARYRLCECCMASAMVDLSRGSIQGRMAFEGWDENVAKQRAVERALLNFHFRDVE